MFRLIGVLLLMTGSIGVGWSVKERLKRNLEDLYRMKQILHMLQNEIEYSRAPLPEALRYGSGTRFPALAQASGNPN